MMTQPLADGLGAVYGEALPGFYNSMPQTSTNTLLTADDRAYLTRMVLWRNFVISKVEFGVISYALSPNVDIGVYDEDLNLLYSTGSTRVSNVGTVTLTLSSSWILPSKRVLFSAIVFDSTLSVVKISARKNVLAFFDDVKYKVELQRNNSWPLPSTIESPSDSGSAPMITFKE